MEFQSRIVALLVSPVEDNRGTLQNIFAGSLWHWDGVPDIEGARRWLARFSPPLVVICDRHLADGNWQQLFRETEALPRPPKFIVCSRHADEHLWVNVLNAGGHDVLPTPFEARETYRVMQSASEAWHGQWGIPAPRASRKTGGSALFMRSAC